MHDCVTDRVIGGKRSECADCLADDLEAVTKERDAARAVLSNIQGSLHVINAYVRGIRKWIKDPNVDVAGDCLKIEEYRDKIHREISAVLFPENNAKHESGD